jgi:hypothetical protein
MPNYNQRQAQQVSSFLKEKAQQAMAEINALTKGHLSTDAKAFSDALVAKYRVEPLELGQHKATIPEQSPKSVEVTWPVKGDKRLLGLVDSQGGYIASEGIKGQTVSETFAFHAPVSENEHNRGLAKQAIERSTASYKAHFEKLNAEVAKHNELLAERIPGSVKLKLEALAKLKAAEDFLN